MKYYKSNEQIKYGYIIEREYKTAILEDINGSIFSFKKGIYHNNKFPAIVSRNGFNISYYLKGEFIGGTNEFESNKEWRKYIKFLPFI